jgi:hypothetical protein
MHHLSLVLPACALLVAQRGCSAADAPEFNASMLAKPDEDFLNAHVFLDQKLRAHAHSGIKSVLQSFIDVLKQGDQTPFPDFAGVVDLSKVSLGVKLDAPSRFSFSQPGDIRPLLIELDKGYPHLKVKDQIDFKTEKGAFNSSAFYIHALSVVLEQLNKYDAAGEFPEMTNTWLCIRDTLDGLWTNVKCYVSHYLHRGPVKAMAEARRHLEDSVLLHQTMMATNFLITDLTLEEIRWDVLADILRSWLQRFAFLFTYKRTFEHVAPVFHALQAACQSKLDRNLEYQKLDVVLTSYFRGKQQFFDKLLTLLEVFKALPQKSLSATSHLVDVLHQIEYKSGAVTSADEAVVEREHRICHQILSDIHFQWSVVETRQKALHPQH